jgi:hypothetical protein
VGTIAVLPGSGLTKVVEEYRNVFTPIFLNINPPLPKRKDFSARATFFRKRESLIMESHAP